MSSKRKHTERESADERPNNKDAKKNEDGNHNQSITSSQRSFAQTFAFLKNTDLYKLPEKPVEVPQAAPRNTNSIIVNSCQRGNPILKFIKNVPYEYGEIIPDYQIGERHCALFLSLRYHNLNPNYIHERLTLLGNNYDLRVILVLVDIKNCKHNLKELSKMCMLANCTLILTWSSEEAGRYLETYKQFENKPPDILQERVETDYFSQVQDVLTTIKSINKTDAITLVSAFGSLRNIINASKEEVVLCPGFGQQKAQRLHKVFNEPFKRSVANVSCSEQESSPSVNVGQLPSTSKLKRPNEILRNESLSPEYSKLKHSKTEKDEVISAKPTISPPNDISAEQASMKLKDATDKTDSIVVNENPATSAEQSGMQSSMQSKDENKLDSSLNEKSKKGTTDKEIDSIAVNQNPVTSVEQPGMHSKDENKCDISLKEKSNNGTPTHKKTDPLVVNPKVVQNLFEESSLKSLPSPKKSDCLPSKETDLQKSPKTSQTSNNKSSKKMSKTEAIYSSGLSRNRKVERGEGDSKAVKSSPQRTSHEKHHSEKNPRTEESPSKTAQDKYTEKYKKTDKSPLKISEDKQHKEKYKKTEKKTPDKQQKEKYDKTDKTDKKVHDKHSKTDKSLTQSTHNKHTEKQKSRSRDDSESSQGSSNPDFSQFAYKSKKLTSPLPKSTSENLNESDMGGKTVTKDSAPVSSKVTSRTLTADNDVLLENTGKFRVGSRSKRASEQRTSDQLIYSTQITNDEFNDLLASDEDEEDIDIYADLL